MTNAKCLSCYQPMDGPGDFHRKCCVGFFATPKAPSLNYTLSELQELAKKVVRKRVTVPGVQAKLSIWLPTKGEDQTRLTLVGVMGNYILKPPVEQYPNIPQIEDCTMHLATLFGVKTVPHALIRLQSGELSYITRRIDRLPNGKKLAMEDMCQLSGKLTEDKYHGSMEQVGKLIRVFSSNPGFDLVRFFNLSVFCFLTGNADMHLKNFSLWTEPDGSVGFTPAYDLLSTRLLISQKDDPEEMALSLAGKKSKLRLSDFHQFGKSLQLTPKQIDNSLKRIHTALPNALDFINTSFLPTSIKKRYQELLHKRSKRLW
jgi:serine/threonine-protein kinase HipA